MARKHDARTARRQARAKVRDEEERAIKEAIKQNLVERKGKILEEIYSRLPRKQGKKASPETPSIKELEQESTPKPADKPMPITQEMDSVIEVVAKPYNVDMPVHVVAPRTFPAATLYHVVGTHIEQCHPCFIPQNMAQAHEQLNLQVPLEEVAGAGVVNPETGETITKYDKLLQIPALRQIWSKAMCKELGRLAQGYGDEKGTDTIQFMSVDEIRAIPKNKTVTYARIVVDYRPQKKDPNRVRLTVGGNLIDYAGELTTRTADLITSKILWNSTLSSEGAKYMCADVKNFYLNTPMDEPEYMKMKADLFPKEFIEAYNLQDKIYKGFIWIRIVKTMYGLPQAGRLSNDLLRKRLAVDGYYEMPHTPGLWKHVSRPIWFTLVVDDFGVKYVGTEHAVHLMESLRKNYEVEEDWTGSLYCGVQLDWNYQEGFVDANMIKYTLKNLKKYNHEKPRKPTDCPYLPYPKKYGAASQEPTPVDDSPPLGAEDLRFVQQVVGSFLYLARAIDTTLQMALNAISNEQAAPTKMTKERVLHFLDYLAGSIIMY